MSRTPFFETFIVAPRPPTENEPPFFERLSQMPLPRRMRFRKRKPIDQRFITSRKSKAAERMSGAVTRARPKSAHYFVFLVFTIITIIPE